MTDTPSDGNTKKKVVLAFLVGVGSILFALFVSYLGFNQILGVVDNLVAPNQKLRTLNNLYQLVSELDHRQRLEAIENPGKPDQDFLIESNSISVIVDTLRGMPWGDSLQMDRLQEIQRILRQRDSLFIKYLQLKSNASRNRRLSKKFDTLARILSNNIMLTDTSVRTTQRKKITVSYSKDSTINPPIQKRSFFNRLFRRKQVPFAQPQPKEKITEEVVVTIDTLALAQRNNGITEASKLIQELGMTELSRRSKLARRELALLKTTNTLFSQIIDIVHQVEAEELLLVQKNNEEATFLFRESIRNMLLTLIVFSLLAAALAYFILIDITRGHYYKNQLTTEKERAERLGQVKQRFLDNMSHEMRTPLQSIIGFAELLLRKATSETRKEIQAIYNSSEHLLHTVNEVLDYSRLDSGMLRFEERKFYFLETVEEVASAVRVQALKKGLAFYLDTEQSENTFVVGDPFRVKQILYNLLGNAVKFTNQGYVKIICQTQDQENHISIQFKIIDSGIGIHENEIDKIFQRFEQANPAIGSIYGGSGLGLTIVQKLIETMGGTLKLESSPGKGSSFIVELHLQKAAIESVSKSQLSIKMPDSAHVLIVDDDPSILELCGQILKNGKIHYTLQNNPGLLYKNPLDKKITHILMDVRMRDVNGFDLSRSLRKRMKEPIPIIAMSAMTEANRDPVFHEVFQALLLKPFRAHELITILGQSSHTKGNAMEFEGDLNTVKVLTANNPKLLHLAMTSFIRETENDIKSLGESIRMNCPDEVKEILHKMKGRIGQFGYSSLYASLNQLEILLESDNAHHVYDKIADLKGAIDHILSKTREELVKLN